MSVLARPETRPKSDPKRPIEPREAIAQAAPLVVETTRPAAAAAGSETHRWFLFLGIPFVLGATFFGLAVVARSRMADDPGLLPRPVPADRLVHRSHVDLGHEYDGCLSSILRPPVLGSLTCSASFPSP